MARYIDADNFRKAMIKRFGCVPCLTDYSEASKNDIPIDDALNLEPTSDVVPKSEYDRLEKLFKDMTQEANEYLNRIYGIRADVAREIFEELEAILKGDGFYYFFRIPTYDELKKKYTEGEPNGSKN